MHHILPKAVSWLSASTGTSTCSALPVTTASKVSLRCEPWSGNARFGAADRTGAFSATNSHHGPIHGYSYKRAAGCDGRRADAIPRLYGSQRRMHASRLSRARPGEKALIDRRTRHTASPRTAIPSCMDDELCGSLAVRAVGLHAQGYRAGRRVDAPCRNNLGPGVGAFQNRHRDASVKTRPGPLLSAPSLARR